MRMRETGKKNRDRVGEGMFALRDKGLHLNGEKSDVAHRQMAVFKRKSRNMLG